MYSLIVPFLNREKYLPRMLDSLNRCHKKPAMTIFVNNGSTDTSEEIIRAFFFSHPGLPYTIINEKSREPRPHETRVFNV